MSWYAIYCKKDQEKKLLQFFNQKISKQILEEAFQFSADRMKKYLGHWHIDTYIMFPNYIFLQSSSPKRLLTELEPYQDFVNVLAQENLLLPVGAEEEQILRILCDRKHHLRMSRGILKNGSLNVIEGPLSGKESCIKKIDKHKRIAILNVQFATANKEIWAGLEIGEKV